MNIRYSIRDLERISGIKAHTLRIWEQRYNILKPGRSDTNIRWYSEDDLRYLLNIGMLNQQGKKISHIATMSRDEIRDMVTALSVETGAETYQINRLVSAMLDMDGEIFYNILNENVENLGMEKAFEEVIFPFLNKTGMLWQDNAIFSAQERFSFNLIRQKLISSTGKENFKRHDHPRTFLLFLPNEEWHETSLLFYAYLIKSLGHIVIYLGQSVSFDDVKKTYQMKKPDHVVSVFTEEIVPIEKYVSELSKICGESTLLVSGYQLKLNSFILPANTFIFDNAPSLKKLVV